ncbi:MAG: hypothetical protein ABIQ33_01685 [Caldimonas sp.]
MPSTSTLRALAGAALALTLVAANAAGSVRTIQSSGAARLVSAPAATGGGIASPELAPTFEGVDESEGVAVNGGGKSAEAADRKALRAATKRIVNRSIATARGLGVGIAPVGVQGTDALTSFDGLRLFDQRFANGGNQFTVEPPDQGLCVSPGFIVESVNDVIRFYKKDGTPASGVIDLNTFYGYPAAIQRPSGPFGPSITDPTCYYDPDVDKFFHVVLTLDVNPANGRLTGDNHLDLAVSNSGDPTTGWTVYRIPVQNTGVPADTPSHPNCPCIGDYPHIGADKYGIYITTNEFPFSGGFNAAQIYALSKAQLAAHAANVNLVLFDTTEFRFQGNPGFTVWPAVSPSRDYETRFGGVEYLMSSTAVFSPSGNGNRIRVFALMNTSAIDSLDPSQVTLVDTAVHVSLYGVPPATAQKPGPAPLGECLNDRSLAVGGGLFGCWRLFVGPPAPTEIVPELVDTNDSRMQQVFFTGGRLYGALDTPVNMPGGRQAGIAYYVIRPYPQAGSLAAVLENEGKFGVAGNSVTYPAIAALPDGRGIISFTLIGPDYYPSAAYIRFNNSGINGNVRVAAAGKGPQDGFSGYEVYSDSNVARWGDYGAAALSEGTFWMASEYIGQVCTLPQYLASGFTCGSTRAALGNWYTRITQVKP